MLTETSVQASDRRAVFVGVDAYEAAVGVVLRDLFQDDDGGWLDAPALLDRLVAEKLQAEAEALVAEGWNWIEVASDLPYGYSRGLRRLAGDPAPLPTKIARPMRRSSPSIAHWRRNTPAKTNTPRRSTLGLVNSRWRWKRSSSGR